MKSFAACLFALMTGCAADPGPQDTQGLQGGSGSAASHIDVRVTDAPAAFESVFVTVTKVEIGTGDVGWLTLSDEPQRFDLLTLQNDATALLGGADLAPGRYGQLRLIVGSASVVIGGVEQSLTIASGARTGIKLNLDADITVGMAYVLVIDFDAARSIKATGKGYLMTPVIQVKSLAGTPIPTPTDSPADAGMTDTGPSDAPAGPSDAPTGTTDAN